MGFLQTISGICTKYAQMDSDTFQGSSCHGRGGAEVTRGSGYKDGNTVEYHVDTVDPHKLGKTPLGGDLSVVVHNFQEDSSY